MMSSHTLPRLLSLTWALALCPVGAWAGEGLSVAQGWVHGHVERVVQPDEAVPLLNGARDCRRASAAPASQRWVLVSYRRVPGHVYRVVPVTPDHALVSGQGVHIQVRDCRVPSLMADTGGV